jgi:hypothetical protein
MKAARMLLLQVELEEAPLAIVHASTSEDEQRLRLWLSTPGARRHVVRAVEDAIDQLAERRAA